MPDAVTPFRVEVGDDQLDDLRRRLAGARWPEPAPVTDWSQGVPVDWLRDLCAYWQDEYDWRRCEKTLAGFPQFTTEVDGLGVHFIHVQSPSPDALPLVMTHGWPGSVVEFLDVIGPLADPAARGGDAADAFHVVCPSLPGYGFSDKPAEPGWDIGRIAEAWAALMARLGYDRYGAQGGDWGGFVGPAVLGERVGASVGSVPDGVGEHDPHADSYLDLPARDRAPVAAVVREALLRPPLLRAARSRRSLRGLGATGAVRRPGAARVPHDALTPWPSHHASAWLPSACATSPSRRPSTARWAGKSPSPPTMGSDSSVRPGHG